MEHAFSLKDAPEDSYAEAVQRTWAGHGIWDYARYDDDGHLWINGLRVVDAVRRYGSPIEVVDTTIVERRAREWVELTRAVADEVRYSGRLDYLYAAKANMASEVAHAAYRSGWGAETSSGQDLRHLEWLRGHGLLPPDLRVVCNGFKLPPGCYGWPEPKASPPAGDVVLPEDTLFDALHDMPYAERIARMAGDGWPICPILDSGELGFFAARGMPAMDIGLRLKFGQVTTLGELDALVSRFGMDRHELAATADDVAAAEHLCLTTFHAMVGAAVTIPVERFAASLRLAAGIWADLRRRHPTLTEFNMGGGVPPLSEDYDHRRLLTEIMSGFMAASAEAGVPPPDLTFELGSLVAAECGFHVFKVVQVKDNHEDDPASADEWAIVDGGLMAAIPDMLLIGKAFRLLAAQGGNRRARPVRVGDLTCDGDGRYPPSAFGPDAAALLPVGDAGHVVILGVGAYQEILSGVRGAHHCGLLEAPELILERRADGRVHGRLLPRQSWRDAAELLGYGEASVGPLAATLPGG